ncbi:hypothetical protein [Streptomyces violascens]|uniref:hypothetical protein n=1 Tax=Streptomyces violascens TaxID=67381 RepID=UPI0036CF8D51
MAASLLDVCGRELPGGTEPRSGTPPCSSSLADASAPEGICRTPPLDHSTVRRFARATSIDELLVEATNRASIVNPYTAYLHQRWTWAAVTARNSTRKYGR